MKLFVFLPIILLSGTAMASEPSGIVFDAKWSGNSRNYEHSTKIIRVSNGLLFRTNWDLNTKSGLKNGDSPIKVINIPSTGGSSCKTVKNIIEDLESKSTYCISMKKNGDKMDIRYTIDKKVVDGSPDSFDNFPGIIGKTFKEHYSFSVTQYKKSCDAVLTSALITTPKYRVEGVVTDILRNPVNASCRIVGG